MAEEQGHKNEIISDADEKLGQIADMIKDACSKFDSIGARMDAMEEKFKADSARKDADEKAEDDDDNDAEADAAKDDDDDLEVEEPGAPRETAADRRKDADVKEEGDERVAELGGFEHAAVADLAAGLLAGRRAEHGGAVGRDLRHVAQRRRVRPHLAVHRRRHQQRAAFDGPGQAHQAQQLVGAALGQAGDEVGAGRRDDDGIGVGVFKLV